VELLSGKWQEGAVNPEWSPLIAPEVNSLAPEAVSTQPLKTKGHMHKDIQLYSCFCHAVTKNCNKLI